MRKALLAICVIVFSLAAHAQEKTTKWYDNIKFSGYGILQYQAEDKEGAKHNEFNLRIARFVLDGKIADFDWRAQIQGTNAKGPGEPTVQLVDFYIEWAKYKEFRVRAGEFKRAFTFENPTNPITQGWYAYAHVINSLSGFGDRTGEKSSGGRDIGIQVQGDLLPNPNGRRLLHYQVGVYNGEGINMKDKDQQKDIIGGVWVMPIEGVRVGVFGWTGSRGGMTDPVSGETVSIKKKRYALSVEYDKDEYTFRAEYLHSQGWGAEKVGSTIIDYTKGDKADGWYVFGIVPVIKSKLHVKARYQTYRDNKEWNRAKTMYEVGLNYFFNKRMQLNAEYARVNDRTIANPDKHNYNFFDVQFAFRF
ncbi:MAG: OprO/OprP family phosphate-selective porin [Bacteroidaceae bacterium]|nr:OprO/OprP family phosphate-selective porin [Bacteroidaceae bacterium]